jgi:hypothetical protein
MNVRNVSHDNVANAAGEESLAVPCRLGAYYSTVFQKSPVAMVRTESTSTVQPHGMLRTVSPFPLRVILGPIGHCRFGRILCRMQRQLPSYCRLRQSPRLDRNIHILPHRRPRHVNGLGSHHQMALVTATARLPRRKKIDSHPAKQCDSRPSSLPAVFCTDLGARSVVATGLVVAQHGQFILAISLRVTAPPAASSENRIAALWQSSLGPQPLYALGKQYRDIS